MASAVSGLLQNQGVMGKLFPQMNQGGNPALGGVLGTLGKANPTGALGGVLGNPAGVVLGALRGNPTLGGVLGNSTGQPPRPFNFALPPPNQGGPFDLMHPPPGRTSFPQGRPFDFMLPPPMNQGGPLTRGVFNPRNFPNRPMAFRGR